MINFAADWYKGHWCRNLLALLAFLSKGAQKRRTRKIGFQAYTTLCRGTPWEAQPLFPVRSEGHIWKLIERTWKRSVYMHFPPHQPERVFLPQHSSRCSLPRSPQHGLLLSLQHFKIAASSLHQAVGRTQMSSAVALHYTHIPTLRGCRGVNTTSLASRPGLHRAFQVQILGWTV